jgi:hypothetical protein
MRAFSISSDGKLAITASETSSKSAFDYLIGNWNIRNRTLKEPLAGSDEWKEFDATQEFSLVLLGLGNVEVVADKDVIVEFHWDKRDLEAPSYSRAFSADAGRTWEWNWYSYFSRR